MFLAHLLDYAIHSIAITTNSYRENLFFAPSYDSDLGLVNILGTFWSRETFAFSETRFLSPPHDIIFVRRRFFFFFLATAQT